jgi:hypothetical protein
MNEDEMGEACATCGYVENLVRKLERECMGE